ncbi:unnamed protein product [Rotaria sp. Silwood1]|nr:unnamed protein product [Rotaria sp. Silwood1]
MKIEENTEQVHCTDHIVRKIAMFQVNSLAKTYFLNPIRCIALSIALTYYFRLSTKEDNLQRNDKKLPSREQLAKLLGQAIPNFDYIVQNELERFKINEFIRTSSSVISLNQQSKNRLFHTNDEHDIMTHIGYTLCEKRFTDLVTSLHSHIRISFTNVVDDYSILLELIHYSSFSVNDKNQTIPMMQTISTLNDHYSIYVNNVSKV